MHAPAERDRLCWTRLRKGSKEALSELFLAYADNLYGYGFLLCGDKEKVEDCLQDLFFQLWVNQARLPSVTHVRQYLMIALRNKIKSSCRGKYFLSLEDLGDRNPTEEVNAEQQWIDEELQHNKNHLLQNALQKLPVKMKQAIYLRYFENMDYSDIARVMNIRRQVAINTVSRAIAHLRAFSRQHAGWIYSMVFVSLY
jgi:RNA polymerase sigma factor (sigma-70 family)